MSHLHTLLTQRTTPAGTQFVAIVTEREATPGSNAAEIVKRQVAIGTAWDLFELNVKLAARGFPSATLGARHG